MSDLNVNMGQMYQDADQFSGISSQSDSISAYVKNALSGLGDFWGNDKVGNEFSEQWGPAIQGISDLFSGISSGMQATADGITTSANTFKNSNDVNSELAGGGAPVGE